MGGVNKEFPIEKVISILESHAPNWSVPVVTLIALQDKNPFKVLLSTIISLRTKDEVTIEASKRLYELLEKPEDIYQCDVKDIENAIYPCGFYKRKAIQIQKACIRIVEGFGGQVPDDIDTLTTFEGVGRKTANLVVSEGYGIPAMCVDVHVHRISNRLGFVETKDPEETERVLRENLPKKYWNSYNSLMVAFGQSICRPVSPYCSQCPLLEICERVGVERYR